MKSFLQQVAQYYAAAPQLENHCFVFPNRRSAKFFEQQLAEAINGPAMMPRMMAMTDFLSDTIGYTTVSQIEALLVLYRAYCQVMGDAAGPMDTFVYWANLIVNDFNDLDMNMVEAAKLYANLSDLRHISTDYLDGELKRDIEQVLNIQLPAGDDNRFWREPWQARDTDGQVRAAYFSLWDKLADIYQTYHHLLRQQGLSTVGRVYRDAAQRMPAIEPHYLPDRVVMVGFSSLSVSEVAIFKALKQRGVADFWWDNALAELNEDKHNPAGSQIKHYAAIFAMPMQLETVTLAGKQVEAVAVPSTVGQAKWAFDRVDRLLAQGHIPHPDNAINTAIVLPDEGLFIPLINSVTDSISHFNVTMGYPMRHANIVSLMHLVARAHQQASQQQGQWYYYREDVKDIMSHPIIKAAFTRQSMQVLQLMEQANEWNVPAAMLCRQGFATLFTPLRQVDDMEQVADYLDRLALFCQQVNESVKAADRMPEPPAADNAQHEHDDDARLRQTLPLQSAFIQLYADAIDHIKRAFANHGVPVSDDTIFFLIDRLTQAAVIPFEGEPVKGLQIMGMQETHSLDFENVIILSMNEQVFPRRHGIASLIPDDLRAAFFMLTSHRQDVAAAYDFYRLISRAQRVVLIYSNSSMGVGSPEPSRFVQQLKLFYADRLQFDEYRVDTRLVAPAEAVIAIDKARTPMHDYVNPSAMDDRQQAHYLSHSSINEYIDCPLKFYLHHVEHLSDSSDDGDFLNAANFGDIIHDTLQALYFPDQRQLHHIVTRDGIIQFKRERMKRLVERNINRFLHHHEAAPIEGQMLILKDTIETYVRRALEYDLQLMDQLGTEHIEVLECEQPHMLTLDFSHEGAKAVFNFTYKPDRVDRIAGQLRMVDYKTGGDPTKFAKLDDLFVSPPPGSSKKRCKAILQQLLYCNAWHTEHPAETTIQPMIYKLRDMSEAGVTHDKKPFVFCADSEVNRQFKQRMGQVISQLLDPANPFTQAPVRSKCCDYCSFTDFCRR